MVTIYTLQPIIEKESCDHVNMIGTQVAPTYSVLGHLFYTTAYCNQ